jgi:hypothetical protein
MSVDEAIACYRRTVTEPPPSSCSARLGAPARASALAAS